MEVLQQWQLVVLVRVCVSSVVRKVFAQEGGFSLQKVFHGVFLRVRCGLTYPEYS